MYSKMKTIQSQIMRLIITKDVRETFSNSDKPCESRCSHIHSDKSNHYHLPKIELPKFNVTLSTGLHSGRVLKLQCTLISLSEKKINSPTFVLL